MVTVDTIGRVRRAYWVQKKKIKAIARELRLSRGTVRRIVRSGETVLTYERKEQPLPKLGPFVEQLDKLLEANMAKRKRERLTTKRLTEQLKEAGYAGGYDSVRRYAQRWRQEHAAESAAAFVPQIFAPGEAYQFDWSHEIVILDGVTTEVKVAQMRLSHSRMPFVRAYPREAQEMLFDAHDKAFAFYRGACERGIYDNMKTAVDAIFVGKERAFNRRFLQMMSHYLVEPTPCTPGAAWEKGQIENQVKNLRKALFVPRPRYKSFEDLNAWLMDQCVAHSKKQPHPEFPDKTIFEVFEREREQLIEYRGPFDAYRSTPASVSKLCLVRFDNNKYSVMLKKFGFDRTRVNEVVGILADSEVCEPEGEHTSLSAAKIGKPPCPRNRKSSRQRSACWSWPSSLAAFPRPARSWATAATVSIGLRTSMIRAAIWPWPR